MIDPDALWDFDDPRVSEARFRAALEGTTGTPRLVLQTQIARALGLQGRFEEGHDVLAEMPTEEPEVAVRVALERGRLLRSAEDAQACRPWFDWAVRRAHEAGLEALHVDALHMQALVCAVPDRVSMTEHALEVARAATDKRARAWEASLLTNLGMAHTDVGDFEAALPLFEQAVVLRDRDGQAHRARVARWMVAWALRNLGRTDEAREAQLALKAELDAAGEADPYVDEELALLGTSRE